MTLIYLMFTGDMRIIRAVLVPAACFLAATGSASRYRQAASL